MGINIWQDEKECGWVWIVQCFAYVTEHADFFHLFVPPRPAKYCDPIGVIITLIRLSLSDLCTLPTVKIANGSTFVKGSP
jgi:hypothetical protein